MISKVDKSLEEVWAMKEAVQNAFEGSRFDNYIDFIKAEMKKIEKQYHYKIEYYQEKKNDVTQYTNA